MLRFDGFKYTKSNNLNDVENIDIIRPLFNFPISLPTNEDRHPPGFLTLKKVVTWETIDDMMNTDLKRIMVDSLETFMNVLKEKNMKNALLSEQKQEDDDGASES